MDKFIITGPCKLEGDISVSGAKNATLPAMAAALLTEDPVVLENVPRVWDVRTLGKILEGIGYDVEREGDRLTLRFREVRDIRAPYDLVRTMRASILCLGPMLARFGRADVSFPGGCAIGPRPVDLHIAGMRQMGAQIDVVHGYIVARTERLRGAHIRFRKVTVTGTENLMMAAVLADGLTVLENAAEEPEVADLGHMLVKMGASIEGIGTSSVEIRGVDRLHGCVHRVIPDRIEAGTYLLAGAIAGGSVRVTNCRPDHLTAAVGVLKQAGLHVVCGGDFVVVEKRNGIGAVDVTTEPYPKFPTDLQAQAMSLLTQADGESTVTETIFENRFLHALELDRLGANIQIRDRTARVVGPSALTGAEVTASDLRASASLVLAALAAEGNSVIHRIYHLDRGYERMEEKLNAIGADIRRIRE